METYVEFPEYQKRCQPYSIPPNYPQVATPQGNCDFKTCVPTGYQPKRENPGDLKFYQYDYTVQTVYGNELSHPGRGWYAYEKTGYMP